MQKGALMNFNNEWDIPLVQISLKEKYKSYGSKVKKLK
jgi:hypothetical protein